MTKSDEVMIDYFGKSYSIDNRYKFIACDANGVACAYTSKPNINDDSDYWSDSDVKSEQNVTWTVVDAHLGLSRDMTEWEESLKSIDDCKALYDQNENVRLHTFYLKTISSNLQRDTNMIWDAIVSCTPQIQQLITSLLFVSGKTIEVQWLNEYSDILAELSKDNPSMYLEIEFRVKNTKILKHIGNGVIITKQLVCAYEQLTGEEKLSLGMKIHQSEL